MGYVPLLIDLAGKVVLVLGGGPVGERKAELFSKTDAKVQVFGLDFTDKLKEMATEDSRGKIELVKGEIKTEKAESSIRNADLVVIATDDNDLNDELADISEREGKLVNKADDLSTQLMIPSILRKGDVIISISTGGKSPAMCKFLRQKIEDWLDESYVEMVRIQEEMKKELKKGVENLERRREILWSLIEDGEIWDLLKSDPERAMKIAVKKARKRVER
ncbi:hypothetical protein AKJ47_00570 [candidate division MSBL1 archaeon SCGC-AAA261G05]|uniref:precorrin-2 dehydrogenase n=3 Tax=candidate division MSBL1 TaxID=215777 RepID=A0A133V119_9EURY|nr:hypothetical protein AKJ42_01625 [candidate division MSBL1 archaeon SCGC-AAA261C02]KXB04126.1 hypothetical protein AKJ47_00570 [candidate division MSBL1 archaeon SCGC-AAA261G05]KXB05036.1 hypothetical protein AKJ48_00520 [candidate division MSBL1 archaeon SCGC-AAA261O19]